MHGVDGAFGTDSGPEAGNDAPEKIRAVRFVRDGRDFPIREANPRSAIQSCAIEN
jgi:hypothetical protein